MASRSIPTSVTIAGSDIHDFERGDAGDMLQRRVADLRAVHVQPLQLLPILDRGQAFVRHILGEIEIQIHDAGQRF